MKRFLASGMFVVVAACTASDGGLVPDTRVLSPDGVQHRGQRYSPDGKQLAWWAPSTDVANSLQLWVGNADLTGARKLPVTTAQFSPILWSPDGTKIATGSNQYSFSDVAVVVVATGEAKRVSQGAGFEQLVAWHADGDRLTYFASSQASIESFVTSSSTGKTTPLIAEEKRPLMGYWSPNGSAIAYLVIDGPKTTIWVADSAGGARRQLTTEGFELFAFNNLGVSPWSPDGTQIAYESRRTGTSDIWAIDVVGGAARQLTRDVRNDQAPAWSPDGKSVAFISDRGRQTDIWTAPAAGGAEQRVTDNEIEEETPVWRPGSNELSFVSNATKSSVWIRGIADGAERQITPDSIRATWFNLSPDGTRVDYVVDRGGAIHDLQVAPVAGGPPRTIIAGGGDIIAPWWSPDGTKIVFQSQRGGSNDAWVVDVAGGAPRQVTNWPGFEYNAQWNGDGEIHFVSDRDSKLGDLWKIPAKGGEPVRLTRDGSIDVYDATWGRTDIFVTAIASNGALTWRRLRPDGTIRPLVDRVNVLNARVPRTGDSLAVLVERDGGGVQAMIVPIAGGRGRPILDRDEDIGAWSPDGTKMLYGISIARAIDVGIVDIATGTKQRLTTTPQSEDGAEWMPDGKSVVFRRTDRVRRIHAVDLSALVAR